MLKQLITFLALSLLIEPLFSQEDSLVLHHKVLGRLELPQTLVRCIISSPISPSSKLLLEDGGEIFGVLEKSISSQESCKPSTPGFYVRLIQGDQIPAILKSRELLVRTRDGDIHMGPSHVATLKNLGNLYRVSASMGRFQGFMLSEKLYFDSILGPISFKPALLDEYFVHTNQLALINLKLKRKIEPILKLTVYPLGPDKFTMGEDSGDPLLQDAVPIRPVRLSAFYLARTELTKSQWQSIMGPHTQSGGSCLDCPVTEISCAEIEAFLDKINSLASPWIYRLPTEAEWEYAARTWGNRPHTRPNKEKSLSPVCAMTPDDLFCDLLGNAWEWTSSLKQPYSTLDIENNHVPGLTGRRVYRGGSFDSLPAVRHPAYRGSARHDRRDPTVGFRLVLEEKKGGQSE